MATLDELLKDEEKMKLFSALTQKVNTEDRVLGNLAESKEARLADVIPAKAPPSDPLMHAADDMMPSEFAPKPKVQVDNPVMGAANAEDIDEVIQAQNRAQTGPKPIDYPKPQTSKIIEGADLAVPDGLATASGPHNNDLKRQFAVQKNRAELVGAPTGENPSNQTLKHMFKGGDKPSAAASMVDDLDDAIMNEMNAASKSTPVLEEAAPAAKGMEGLMAKLKNMPDEALLKMGPLGEKIMQSRGMQLAGKVASSPAGKFAGQVGLPLVGSAFEAANAMESAKKGDVAGTAMSGAGALAGPAMIAGSAAASPLLALSGGYAAGNLARSAMGMGGELPPIPPQDPNAEPTLPPVSPPGQGGGIPPMPSNAMGPFADMSKYKPSVNPVDAPLPNKVTEQMGGGVAGAGAVSASGNASAGPTPLPPGFESGFSNNTVDNLKKEQDAANETKRMNQLLRSLQMVTGASIGGKAGVVKNDTSYLDAEDKIADEKVAQFKERVAKEEDDPKSNYSKEFKAYITPMLKKLGMDTSMVDKASAKQIKELMPFTQKMYEAQETREMRKEMASERAKDRAAITGIRHSEKQDQADTKRLDTLNKTLESQMASSRSGFGKDANALNTIQNVKALFEGQDLDSLDNRQVTEVARVLDRVLSGGSPTISGTEHLTPDSARMYIAKKMEYVTNKRQGAGAGDFMKSIQHTFDREEDIAKKRIKDTSQSAVGSYLDLAERNPEAWDSMMAQKNLLDVLGTDALKKRKEGGIKNRSETATKESSSHGPAMDEKKERGIQKVMEKNGVSREEAIKALKAAGRL